MAESDTIKSSVITGHPFMPRQGCPWICGYIHRDDSQDPPRARMCRLAEAAHRETTVKR